MGIYILSAVVIIILLLCWLRYGRDAVKPVITVETMPPDGLDPMQMECIASGALSSKSLYAMVLLWLSKGYVRFIDKDDRFGVEKVRAIDEAEARHAKALFNRLFKRRKKIWFDTMPKGWDAEPMLTNMTFKTISNDTLLTSEKAAYGSCLILYLAAWFAVFVYLFNDVLRQPDMPVAVFCIISVPLLIGIGTVISAFQMLIDYNYRMHNNVLQIALTVGLMTAVYGLILKRCITVGLPVLQIMALTILYYAGILLCSLMKKRPDPALYGRILGFREFIKTAEADKLKTLSREYPEYGIDILPYAVIFNLGTEWSDKCEAATIIDNSRKRYVRKCIGKDHNGQRKESQERTDKWQQQKN